MSNQPKINPIYPSVGFQKLGKIPQTFPQKTHLMHRFISIFNCGTVSALESIRTSSPPSLYNVNHLLCHFFVEWLGTEKSSEVGATYKNEHAITFRPIWKANNNGGVIAESSDTNQQQIQGAAVKQNMIVLGIIRKNQRALVCFGDSVLLKWRGCSRGTVVLLYK